MEGSVNRWLPTMALNAGFALVSLRPPRHGADPYILRDRWGRLLHTWPERYEPTWMEVWDICRQFIDC
jgi:hypothetical protein